MKISEIDYKMLDRSEKIYLGDKVKYNGKFWKVVYWEYSFVFQSDYVVIENLNDVTDRMTVMF